MRIHTLLSLATGCAALVACQSMDTMRMTGETILFNCSAGACPTINLTVVESGTSANPKCEIRAISNLDLRANAAGPKMLTFFIPDGNYEFSDLNYKFALFVQAGDDPTGRFDNVTINGPRRLVLRFDHRPGTLAKEFKYALTVKRPGHGGQFCMTLDPWLIS